MVTQGSSSREKGARGEREVVTLLNGSPMSDFLPFLQAERNLSQSRRGGADIINLPGLCIEVKRCERLRPMTWWRQACRQARILGGDRVPVLFYRCSRDPWLVCTPKRFDRLSWDDQPDDYPEFLTVNFELFLKLYERMLK
jgi:hypothetical protein